MSTSARKRLPGRLLAATALVIVLANGGCAVGPNFTPPAPPRLDQYAADQGAERLQADGASQTIEPGAATDAAWWRLFASPALNDLVAAGLKNSPTLKAAEAALTQSKDLARAGAGVFFPQVGTTFDSAREHSSPELLGEKGPGSTFSLYTLTGQVSYAIDLFGGERRTVEALTAQADVQRQALGAARLLLTGNIVDAAIARAGYADEADTLADMVGKEQAQRDILKAQYDAGAGPLSAVLEAEQQLAADRQSLAGARQRLAASQTLLQTLIGREPGEAAPPPPTLDALAVPPDAPVSLPSQLVRQRPDILQAEASLHQASAQVGVATAAMFPSISLTGDYGAAGASLSALGGPLGRFWSVGPTLDLPIFRGGALLFERRAAQAGLLKAEADYRQTVLTALEQTSDQLKALDADAETTAANRAALDAASLNAKLAESNLSAGVIGDYDALTLQIAGDRALLGMIAAKAQRLQDVVGLYLASGGGWTGGAAIATQNRSTP
jgi:NodT family efflux transporter outer membrane factor (OMF) lipoprotein